MHRTAKLIMKVPFLFFLTLVSNLLSAHGLDQIDFIEVESEKDWDKVFRQAKESNQLIFVDAYTDWCSFCHKLDKEVYTDGSVMEYFEESFINVKFDAESEFGYQLADFYGIDSYPTLLFLTPERNIFMRIEGYVPAASLLSYGQQSSEEWDQIPILMKAFESAELEKESYLELIKTLERTDQAKAEEVAGVYANMIIEDDYKDLETLWFLSRFANGLDSRHYRYITDNKSDIIKMHGESEYSDYISGVYNDNLMLAIKYGDKKLLDNLLQEVLPKFVPNAELPSAQYVTESVFYAQREEFDQYKLAVNGYMNNHLATSQKPDFIISTTVEIIENYQNEELYSFATQILDESIKIDNSRFESFALLGYVKGLLKEYPLANQNLTKALELAKSDEQKAFVNNLKQAVEMMRL